MSSNIHDGKSGSELSKDLVEPIITIEPINESEKITYSVGLVNAAGNKDDLEDEPQYDFASAEFANIPEIVRNVVGFEDDPSLPVLTFRSILLSAIFCVVGSVVSQLS